MTSVLYFLLPPWLAACAIHDLRTREVPGWLLRFPLALALIWAAMTGNLVASLMALSILISENIPLRTRGFYVGAQGLLAFFAFQEGGLTACLLSASLLGIWLAWKLGAFGGADAQVLITLVLVIGAAVIIPISVAVGLQGMVGLLRKQPAIPALAGIYMGLCTALWLPH